MSTLSVPPTEKYLYAAWMLSKYEILLLFWHTGSHCSKVVLLLHGAGQTHLAQLEILSFARKANISSAMAAFNLRSLTDGT